MQYFCYRCKTFQIEVVPHGTYCESCTTKAKKAREKKEKEVLTAKMAVNTALLLDRLKMQEKKNEELEAKIRDLTLVVYELENRLDAFSSIKHLEMDEIK